MFTKLIQQGDVLFKRAGKLPEGLKPKKADGVVVFAKGETTGHAHTCDQVEDVELFEDENGTVWCSVKKPIEVQHQEHKTVTVPEGEYQVGIVREVDPFQESIRSVKD